MTSSITHDATLGHTPDEVWTLLTHRLYVNQWLLPTSDFDATPGAHFTFDATSLHATGYSPTVSCTVTESSAPHTLSYTWNDAATSNPTGLYVTYTLTPAGAGTHLAASHHGFNLDNPHHAKALTALTQAWHAIFARLCTMTAPSPVR